MSSATSTENRIAAAFLRLEEQIAKRIKEGITTKERVEDMRKALDMDLEEYCKFQELKSLAVLHDKLTLDEGMTVYEILGSKGPWKFNSQPVHVKSVLTGLFAELLKWKINAGV